MGGTQRPEGSVEAGSEPPPSQRADHSGRPSLAPVEGATGGALPQRQGRAKEQPARERARLTPALPAISPPLWLESIPSGRPPARTESSQGLVGPSASGLGHPGDGRDACDECFPFEFIYARPCARALIQRKEQNASHASLPSHPGWIAAVSSQGDARRGIASRSSTGARTLTGVARADGGRRGRRQRELQDVRKAERTPDPLGERRVGVEPEGRLGDAPSGSSDAGPAPLGPDASRGQPPPSVRPHKGGVRSNPRRA